MIYYIYDSDNNILIPASPTITTENAYIVNPSASQYATLHKPPAYPLAQNDIPPTPPEGKISVPDRYELADGKWHRTWKYEDIPQPSPNPMPPQVYTYKKSYIAQWLWANGLLDELETLMDANLTAKFFWEYSTEFDSNHEQWNEILNGVKLGLGLSDEDVDMMLKYGLSGQSKYLDRPEHSTINEE